MKKALFVVFLLMLTPVLALGEIRMEEQYDGGNRLIVFSAEADVPQAPGKAAPVDPVQMMLNMQIAARFEQDAAAAAGARASVHQEGSLYQDGKIASMARTWQGEQADGREGSSAAALNVSLETGLEFYFDELFDDVDAAVAHMEAIIERDVLSGMSDYMEFADLLPMPQDCFSFDELGLTVYWPQDRYRYFSGEAGSVRFLWHEIADFIGEGSPVYALSRQQDVDVAKLRTAMALMTFETYLNLGPDMTLGEAGRIYPLGDPDYTTDALVYPVEQMRGFALEIPKYAETTEEETVISAVRASCIGYAGLATGKTTMETLYAIFGEPKAAVVYDEDAALDALLEPGESLFFDEGYGVLQAHFDQSGVLSCLILRRTIPQSLL